jgi:hypothetical protein
MAEYEEYKFPDEQDQNTELDIEVEIVDDTPEEDKGRQPMPKEIVDDLDRDELEEYDEGVTKNYVLLTAPVRRNTSLPHRLMRKWKWTLLDARTEKLTSLATPMA